MSIGLPGDPSAADVTERMIRVDHAGEYGATRIYAGQLAVPRLIHGIFARRMTEDDNAVAVTALYNLSSAVMSGAFSATASAR